MAEAVMIPRPAQNTRADQIGSRQQVVGAYVPRPVRDDVQVDPFAAIADSFREDVVGTLLPWEAERTLPDGESFWEDLIGTLLPWEVKKQKPLPGASTAIVGVGITFRRDLSGALLIHQIVQGGAASRTRMFLEHDELVCVDGEDVYKRPLSDVSRLILGPAGTVVSLTVFRRASGNTLTLDVVRAENPVQLPRKLQQSNVIPAPVASVNVALPSVGSLTALHTVVMLASRGGESALEEVAGLLVAGHDINARDADGCTPIFFASGSAPTMQLLLNKRAEVNLTNRLGNSPLHYAAAANSVVCIEMLVRNGADRGVRCAIGLTPHQLASSLKKTDAAGYLRALDVRAERVHEFRPLPEKKMSLNKQLLFAISDEGPVTDGVPVAMLLQAGADPNVKDDATSLYALHLGIFQQSPATVRALLLAGAEQGYVQQADDFMSPVACALIDRQIAMTDTLDQRMFPPLVLRELIEGDCDVNAEIYIMQNVMAPLHMAILNNDFAAAELLIEEGADLNQMDKHGQTPEEVAKGGFLVPQSDPSQMSTLFARHVGDTWPFRSNIARVDQRRQFCRPLRPLPDPLLDDQEELDLLLGRVASEGDRYNVIKLCEAGANISINYTIQQLDGPLRESTWADGMDTPLNRACAKGSLRTVEIMLEGLGAQVNSTGMRSGFSPLHAAAQAGNCNVVRYLLAHGAHASAAIVSGTGKTFSTHDAAEPYVGYTSLMLAVMAKDPWSVNELLLAGASNEVTSLDGKSPQWLFHDLVSAAGQSPIIDQLAWLLEPGAKGVARESPAHGAARLLLHD